ncbi:hypothetical protein A9Z42_0032310 [Trichoderma parareesei]|uniref:Zn(2)-C6 fungal-type domain-containing protein n=1 Tax=Trichoderma parareesei TaxID=858221 RepID=A0A2H2ZHW4_TRIPA|nr:hypothetical protein A9Z42_0032310 [Trichoderma parareesei]
MDLDPRLRPGDGEAAGVSNSTPSPAGLVSSASLRGRDNADTPSSSTVGSGTPQYHHQLGAAAGAGAGIEEAGVAPGASSSSAAAASAAAAGGGAAAAAAAAGEGDAKKSRACEACRGLKVRCEPDAVEGEPCKRCRKAGRSCVVTAPTRKRQKKTDSRVSELEKKIDALTASLHARAGGGAGGVVVPGLMSSSNNPLVGQPHHPQPQHHQHPSPHHPHQPQARHQSDMSASGGGYPMFAASTGVGVGGGPGGTATGSARPWTGGGMEASPMTQSAQTPPTRTPQDDVSAFQPPIVMAGQKRKAHDREGPSGDDHKAMTPSTSWSGFSRPTEGDIVDRGLVTMEHATGLFNKYKEHMVRHLPAVVFPPSTTVMELRKTKPTLFLAIMAAATGENHSLQRVLQRELMQLFAEKVIVTGEKNLELVQALHVAVIWYWPPEHFEELKFYQLVHIAAVMAIDIGLGRKGGSRRGPPPFRRNPPPDPCSIECRRTWLTCFFLALNTSMSLHRPNLIRWTPFMTESLEILESSPDAAPTDKYFCHLVWTHRLAEEVGSQFSLDDPSTVVNITDARTQYALRALERDLDKYIASIPKNLMQHTLRLNFNVVNLYMHEMALHSDSTGDNWRPPFNTEALKDGIVNSEPLSAAHINALSACLTAIDGIFNTFLSMDVTSIRCLPVFNFMRVAYGVVILIKMYFSASSPGSEMGKVIHKDNMRVEYYLEALLDKFRATAADNKCRPAAKFLVVLAMLRSWFFKQGKGEGGGSAASDDGGASSSSSQQQRPYASQGTTQQQQQQQQQIQQQLQQQQQQQQQQIHQTHQAQHMQQQQQQQQHSRQPNVNTPLQLLSEVATTGRDGGTASRLFASLNGAHQHHPQPFFHDSVSSTTDSAPAPASVSNTNNTNPSSATMPPQQMPGPSPSSTDLDSAMAPAFPPWMSAAQPMLPADLDIVAGALPTNFDIEGLNLAASDLQDMYESGAKIVMNEPWFTDAFQGLPDPNLFPF